MTHKNLILPIFTGLMVATTIPAFALEVSVTSNGTVQFFNDSVLGETSDSNKLPNTRPTRQVMPYEQKQLRIHATAEGVNVGVENKNQDTTTAAGSETNQDELTSERLRLEIPAQLREKKDTTQGDVQNHRVDQKLQVQELSGDIQARTQETKDEYREHIDEVRQERRERLEEHVEIVREQTEQKREQMEIRSRDIGARLQQGAEFVLDPETNTVSVMTPSGNTHELNHLPDQAIERMIAAGVIGESEDAVNNMEIIEEDNGNVVYQTQKAKTKRLLGLFSREIPTEVSLDDDTGIVTEEEVKATTFVGRVLDRLSF